MKTPLNAMKSIIRNALLILMLSATDFLHAQISNENLNEIEATTPIPAYELPLIGAFYSAAHPQMPPLPGNLFGLAAWPLANNIFLLDDLNGAQSSGFYAMDDYGPPIPGGDGSSSDGSYFPAFNFDFSTNSLWLQMLSVTNGTADIAIYPPWDVTNGVYDLLYCTNLLPPINWQWLLRTDPGQTNVLVPNATDIQGFYSNGIACVLECARQAKRDAAFFRISCLFTVLARQMS
jgi:hypothetical protein